MYILLGKPMGLIGGQTEFWFNVARLPVLFVAVFAVVFWLRQVFSGNNKLQTIALLLIVFGGGISWLVWPLTAARNWPFAYFPDISKAEWTFILTGYNAPHYLLGFAQQAALFASMIRWDKSPGEKRWAAIALVMFLMLGLTYVYNVVIVLAVLGTYLLLSQLRTGRFSKRQWMIYLLFLLVGLLLVFAYLLANTDPVWREYISSSVNDAGPPPPLGVLIGLGIPGALALAGLRNWLKSGQTLIVPVWIVVNVALMYFPQVGHGGRFAMGFIIPVGTLAAFGLEKSVIPFLLKSQRFSNYCADHSREEVVEVIRRMTLIVSAPSSLMVFLLMIQSVTIRRDLPNYMPISEREAAAWLAEQTTEEDLVLSYYPVSNYLPAVGNTHVFAGQFFLTPDFDYRLELVEQYLNENTADSWRRKLIRDWGITHVYVGRYEKEVMVGNITPEGKAIYKNGDITIYKVD
jgi:hypothetical protein